jgi:hypothetical protein
VAQNTAPATVGDTLTAEQTLAYINNQFASYPDRSSGLSCPSMPTPPVVSLSSNHRYIIVDNVFKCSLRLHYEMDVLQLYSGPTQRSDGEISPLDTGAFETINGDQSEVRFMGGGSITWNGQPGPPYHTHDDGGDTAWGPYVTLRLTAPEEIARRLGRAMNHLVEVLKTEADAKIPKNDPFAKPNE